MATLGIEGRSTGTKMSMTGMTGVATVTIPAAVGTKGGGAVMAGRPQYQGGSSFTVFSAQGSNPLVNCKLCGRGVQKVYDKTVKGNVYACTGAHSSKLQLPKDESKTGLQLIHPYMVLQLFVPAGQHFTLELRLSDTTNTRRKLYFSTSFSELKITPLHCQIPLSMVMRNTWLSLALHVSDLFYNCFRVMSFRSVDVIVLGPVCKLRKIFTMRNRLADGSGNPILGIEEALPQEHMFAPGVEAVVQVIDMSKLQSALGIELPTVEGCGRAGPESVLSARKLTLNKLEHPRQVHVAFGSRMPLTSSTAQLNATPTSEEKLEKAGKDRQGRPPQDPSFDPTKASEKPDTKTCQNARSTPDALNPNATKKGENNASPGNVGNSEATKQERKAESAPIDASATDNKPGNLKGARPAKKKEEPNWKREGQAVPCIKQGRKEPELVRAKDFRQQARYEDSPPITPCGWERCASARGSDDMSFKVHTLFEKLGDYAHDDTEVFPSLSREDGQAKDRESSGILPQEGQSTSSNPANTNASKEQQDQQRRSKDRETPGLKFYQFELEKDFMLREGNSASASDDDLSWFSGSSGRASANAINDLADFVKGTRFTSSEDRKKFEAADANKDGSRDEPVDVPFGSTEDLFVVHEQDNSSLNRDHVHDAASDDEEEETYEFAEEPEDTFEEHMVAKPVLKLESRSTSGPSTGIQLSPGPSSSHRRSRSGQLEEICGHKSKKVEDHDGTSEDDLDLLYDPTLDCYYDPKTNRYYELK